MKNSKKEAHAINFLDMIEKLKIDPLLFPLPNQALDLLNRL